MLKALLSDHQGCQEGMEEGAQQRTARCSERCPWRHARALLWRGKVLIQGATQLWKDQMLLCGEEDRSAIDGAPLIAMQTRQGGTGSWPVMET